MSTIEYVRKLGYENVQNYINIGPHGTVNMERLDGMVDWMKDKGWTVLDHDEIEDFYLQPRDLIKYLTINKESDVGHREINNVNTGEINNIEYEIGGIKFRSGGWFIEMNKGDDDKYYILYKPHKLSEPPISVQLEHIDKLYVLTTDSQKELKEQKINKKSVEFVRPTERTRYPVCMIDENGETVAVYYAKDEFKRKRFMNTTKFERAKKNGWKFKDN